MVKDENLAKNLCRILFYLDCKPYRFESMDIKHYTIRMNYHLLNVEYITLILKLGKYMQIGPFPDTLLQQNNYYINYRKCQPKGILEEKQ